MGNILEFVPTPKVPTQLVLRDNIDIAFCLWAINMFGVQHMEDGQLQTVGPKDLGSLRVEFVLDCLKMAQESELLSDKGKAFITKLLQHP
jgi:hypothetical protein|tara:strand:- start:251 stop:520 length:270 start_codon:yes stop_codon:yes gene_type:complete